MINPHPYTYDEFPPSKARPDGIKTLETDICAPGCAYTADIEYARRGKTALRLQILTPSGMGARDKIWPLVVYIPGSAWHRQNIHRLVPSLGKLAERGFVVAMVEYRPSDEAIFPAQIEDAKAATGYLARNAGKYNIDPQKTVLYGDSSGGHTALIAAYTWGREIFSSEEEPGLVQVCGVVDYFGPVDISRMNDAVSTMDHTGPDSPEGYLIGRKNVLENPELAAPTVVTNYINGKSTPPTLIIHGDKDRLVPFEQSVILYEALKTEGAETEFYRLKNADHGGTAFWSNDVLDIVEGFIRGVTG